MDDYESQYEEYKKSLLRSNYFMTKLREEQENSVYTVRDYIDRDGVLPKVGVLSGVGGFCYALYFSLVQLDEFPGIMVRAILVTVGTVCFFWAGYIGSKFKEDIGKTNFSSCYFDRHIEKRATSDKEMEARNIVRSFLSREIDSEEFQKRYEDLSKYDRFAEDLKNDCDFSSKTKKYFKKM